MKYIKKINEHIEFDPNKKFVNGSIGDFFKDHGQINYRLYEDNILIFMGSTVDKKYRGQGIFKKQLYELIDKFQNSDMFVPITNKNIIELFLRNGFYIYNKPIRYWGKIKNGTNFFRPAGSWKPA
jgi:GNAT superfamily N-acetyltransferase